MVKNWSRYFFDVRLNFYALLCLKIDLKIKQIKIIRINYKIYEFTIRSKTIKFMRNKFNRLAYLNLPRVIFF